MNIGVVLQTNAGGFDCQDLADALLSLGDHVDVGLFKFEHAGFGKHFSWGSLSKTGITGVMGSISFVRQTKDWFEGGDLAPFFNSNLHYCHKYIHQIPLEARLNAKAVMLPRQDIKAWGFEALARLMASGGALPNKLFFRPDQALKVCEAELVEAAYFDQWVKYLELHTGTSDSSLFWVAPEQSIKKEYRCLVSQGVVKSISSYGFEQEPENVDATPIFVAIQQFLEPILLGLTEMDPAYVLDVAELDSGELRVIELNCLSTSGLYKLNLHEVANALVDGLRLLHREWYDID